MRYILTFFILIYARIFSYEYELSLCAIFQNEAPYLREWIEFHKLVGVQHFYLYNNLSTDDYIEVLNPYIKDGSVELIDWPYPHQNIVEWNGIQCGAYNDAISRSRYVSKWLAVIDTDEFVFPVQTSSLIEFLKDYENQVGVCVNWQMYGTSNVYRIKPDELLIEKLLLRAPLDYLKNINVKSIIRPEYVSHFDNPHYAHYKFSLSQVNSDHKSFSGPFSPYVCIDKIRINHYWLRDEYFMWNFKLPRRKKWTDNYERDKLYWIAESAKMNAVLDTSILKYANKLYKNIFVD